LTGQAQKGERVKDMLKLPPMEKNPTLAQIIIRAIRLIVNKSGGWITIIPNNNDKEIRIKATMEQAHNGDYILSMTLLKQGDHYVVTNFSSFEKDSDMGAPYWMPAEWTLAFSLKPGEKWIINKGSDVIALFEAHTKWSKFEGYYTVFEGKD